MQGQRATKCARLLATAGHHARPARMGVYRIATLLASRRLAPTSFTRKPALQTVGGGRSSIRSTTGINLPPSICTRRSDGFCHGRNLLIAVIETSPITRQTDGGGAAEARRWAAAVRELMNQLDVPCTSGSKLPNQLGRPLTVLARYLRPVQLRRPLTVLAWISSRYSSLSKAAHVK
ncbi:hypothetical protein F511_11819 [Dorcoceras hygrometricum]|uniref:Uncharacterized protein n=1 Tax=Dorcoceras hygrometricum TaxID=472368 RepID=A0A2Z7DDD3_9LAMI|nr:hypothetical protein F511_11819 [Dorcoceras hygrometricum]